MGSRNIYRNYDLKTIRLLLKEIGVYKYEQALENMKVEQKPLTMKGWFLEDNGFTTRLCHRYPSRFILKLMDVDRYKNIPFDGWKREKESR